MTREEAGERYNIPAEVLREHERWGRSGETAAADRPYDQSDIERLSRIMTLYDVGFKKKKSSNTCDWLCRGMISSGSKRKCCGKSAAKRWMKSMQSKSSWTGSSIFILE